MERRLLNVALTGNIAAGKSTVARVWREQGATVIEADELARRAVLPGTPALERIVERWGPGILLADGTLDRAAMRDVVFRDDVVRRYLEAIVHPEVQRLRAEELKHAERAGLQVLVSDIPLLFEAGLEDQFDVVVLVDAPLEIRLSRLLEDRGLGEAEARRMIAAQAPAEPKRARADIVIDNISSREALESRAREVWNELSTRRGRSRVEG